MLLNDAIEDHSLSIGSAGKYTLLIKDNSVNHLSFNVMPGKKVRETLSIREYRVRDKYIEAEFDREYQTDMLNSPSHLIFLSVLIHLQKMAYLYFCYHIGLPYHSDEKERFKIWPTNLNIKIPELIQEENNLVQKCWVDSIRKLPNGHYYIKGRTAVQSIEVSGDLIVIPIEPGD